MLLQISAQYGDPKATDVFWQFQRGINQEFEKIEASELLEGLESLSIVLRVSGAVRDFGTEGPERLKKVARSPKITIDLAIPEARWKGVDQSEFTAYLREGLVACCEALVEKAVSMGGAPHPDRLSTELKDGIDRAFTSALP